jgi:antitoxin component YwqK of YwqJK toxin-antitoxin module
MSHEGSRRMKGSGGIHSRLSTRVALGYAVSMLRRLSVVLLPTVVALTTACAGSPSVRPRLRDCPVGSQRAIRDLTSTTEEGGDLRIVEVRCERPDGTLHGPYAHWEEPGPTTITGFYRDGKRDGEWATYYWGKRVDYGRYVAGRKDGEWIYRSDETGKIELWWRYRRGHLEESRGYCENGSVEWSENYVEGRQAGESVKHYCEDGKVKELANYRDDKLDGELIRYYADGHESYRATFKMGVLDGPYAQWRSDGVKVEGQNVDGLQQGTWRYSKWTLDQSETPPFRVEVYDHGQLVEQH